MGLFIQSFGHWASYVGELYKYKCFLTCVGNKHLTETYSSLVLTFC